mgnify:CR=1 FL=1
MIFSKTDSNTSMPGFHCGHTEAPTEIHTSDIAANQSCELATNHGAIGPIWSGRRELNSHNQFGKLSL